MESPDRHSPTSDGEIQGSPLFNFLCSLSPIKPVKSARVAQTYSEISFPPPPAVFVSPRMDAQKESRSRERNQGARGDNEEETSEIKVRHAFLNPTDKVHRFRAVHKMPNNQMSTSPCSSPSKLVEEYLAEPTQEGLEDELAAEETLLTSNTYKNLVMSGDMDIGGMEKPNHEQIISTDEPKPLHKNVLNDKAHAASMESRDKDAQNQNPCNPFFGVKQSPRRSGVTKKETILDFDHEAPDLQFFISEEANEPDHDQCLENWHNVTSSTLSELSVEQVEGYIASLRGIVNEEQEENLGVSTESATNAMADESHMIDNLEAEQEARCDQRPVTCQVKAPHPRGVRRRCLDFEISEGHLQSKTGFSSLRLMHLNTGNHCQDVSTRKAESSRSLLVLKKRVSATLGAISNESIHGVDDFTTCSRKNGTASGEMTHSTSINIKLSRSLSEKDMDTRRGCPMTRRAGTSPVPAGMPAGIGLHLNSLTGSMPCMQLREIDGPGISLKAANAQLEEIPCSRLQKVPIENPQKCFIPGRHTYARSTSDSRKESVSQFPETRGMDDCELQSECSSQDFDSSNSAICVRSIASGAEQMGEIVPLNVLNKRPSPLGRKRVLLQQKPCQGDLERAEESTQSPHSPKKKRRPLSTGEKSGDGCKRCNCKKSKCLKLYCECFAAGVYCVGSCTCHDCFNKPEFEETVMDTRQQIESRNPLAFAPKIVIAAEPSPTKREDCRDTPASARHKRGCNCKKSHCLKKYCECFQAGVGCSDGCRCESCQNVYGRKEVAEESDQKDHELEALVVDKEIAEEHIEASDYCNEPMNGSQLESHDLSPITPAFQHAGQHRTLTKSSYASKRRSCSEELQSPTFLLSSAKPCRSPSRLLRSSKGTQNSPPIASTGFPLPKFGCSPVSTPRIMKIGGFSPRWDGLDDICTLTPGLQAPLRPTPVSASVLDRVESSPSINEQNCNELSSCGNGSAGQNSQSNCLSSVRPSQGQNSANMQGTPMTPMLSSTATDNKFCQEDSKASANQFMEDDGTPEFLKDAVDPGYLPACLVNSSSPKHKRVSPPHHHAVREASHRGLQSPGVRNSRKFILQSVPSASVSAVREQSNGIRSREAED